MAKTTKATDDTTAGSDLVEQYFGITQDFVPDTFQDLEEYFSAQGGIIEFQGSQWELVRDKAELIGVPFIVADVRFYQGKFGDACAVLAMVEGRNGEARRIVFNDGSTGVYAQMLTMVTNSKRRGGFACRNGLRVSEYEYQETDLDGNPLIDPKTGQPKPPVPSKTYYVA